jgi:hypothetical protein
MSEPDTELDVLIMQAECFLREAGFVVADIGDVSVRWACDDRYSHELRILFNGTEPKHEPIP